MFFVHPFPRVGDDVYCHHHRDTVRVETLEPEIRVKCTECRYSRGFGQAQLTADTYAAKHSVTRRHKVNIVRGDDVIRTVGDRSGQTELLLEDPNDPPPF